MSNRFTMCRSILPLVVLAAACGSGGLRKSADRPDASGTGGAILGTGGASGLGGSSLSTTITTSLGGAGGTVPDAADTGGAVADARGGDAIDAALPNPDVALLVDTGTIDTGVPTDDFCTGSASKVALKNQIYSPAVTTKETDPMLSCCVAYSARLHLHDSLGFDLEVVVRVMGGASAEGTYVLGDSGSRLSASLRPSWDGSDGGWPADATLAGTASILGAAVGANSPWQLGLCVTVQDPASSYAGLRIYVPGVNVAPYGWVNRFGIWRLADPAIDAVTAAQNDLASLVLAAEPLVNLRDIDYVQLPPPCPADGSSPCDMWIGLNLAFLGGSTVQSYVGKPTVRGVPFVAVADGERIYLGAFMTGLSSYAIAGPEVMVEDIAMSGFPILRPMNLRPAPPDLRADPRIVKVLTEAGKAVP
jgi:hypothetical protein